MNTNKRKIYIADTRAHFLAYMHEYGLTANWSSQFIRAGDTSQLMGLSLAPDDIVIIGDPAARFSFWETLRTRIQRK